MHHISMRGTLVDNLLTIVNRMKMIKMAVGLDIQALTLK